MAFRLIEQKPVLSEDAHFRGVDRRWPDLPAKEPRSLRAKPARAKSAYPGKIAIRHAGEAARSLGIDIGGIEVSPDGTIRVLDRSANPAQPNDEFEAWLQSGKLA